MPASPVQTRPRSADEKREHEKRLARDRMARRAKRRRAAIKAMPPALQFEITERARASRAKYRAQHRMQLIVKERCRREMQNASGFASILSPKARPKSEVNIDLLHVSPAASEEADEPREHSTSSTASELNIAAAAQSIRAASEDEEEVDQLDADDEDSDTSDLFTDVYSETEGAVGRFLRTPTAQQFHDKLSRPIKTYRRKVLCHEARAACRAVQAHADNMSQVGRALGVKHHQIRKAVLNQYKPPDDVSRDHNVLHPDFRIYFPPLPPPPVTNSKPSTSSKRKRVPKSLIHAESQGEAASDDEEDRYSKPRTRTRGTDESAPAAPPRTLRSSNVRAPAPVVLVERKARSVGRNAEPAAAGNPPPAHAPVQRCPASDPLFPTDASHPAPSIDCFLQDVGGYNLTRLSATFDAVGITSMHDLIRLAQLPAVRRVKTLTHIFDSYPDVTKLNVVSLAHTIADLRSSDFSASSQQPGVTSGSHPPPSVDIFLMDVGGFDLSHWRARFAEVGIVSIDDLRPLGRVPDTRRRQMLLDLLEPHPITTLHLVSLSLSVAELV
ncbi:hypothetical protein C8R43DRAFT_1143279 [Mycena crocata]|nr:hypothetical protein C8R43DRAFT_1143279 [Mycena crocata]